jgi:hypothetical protein
MCRNAKRYAHLIGCLTPKSERRVIIRTFVAACCDRISERLGALAKRSEQARTSNGRELVVIRGAAVCFVRPDFEQSVRRTDSAETIAKVKAASPDVLTLSLWPLSCATSRIAAYPDR